MKKYIIIGGGIILMGAVVALLVFIKAPQKVEVISSNDRIVEPLPSSEGITNFEECTEAGNPIKESYPRQCTTEDGKNFRENIEEPVQGLCVVTGCSGHVCMSEELANDLMTTCEYKEEYACYTDALCERQEDEKCGWTQTEELQICLQKDHSLLEDVDQVSVIGEDRIQESEVEIQEVNTNTSMRIKDELISWGYESVSQRKIDSIILHSSFNSLGGDEYDVKKILAIYKQYGVGAHYIIDREGVVYRLIQESDIAYHAGVSVLPDGRTGVNQVSIGIEIMANYEDGLNKAQYSAVNDLVQDIQERYSIEYVLGHSDIAPARKSDPWNIDWGEIDGYSK